jgi:hypothetical protein
VIAFAQIDRLQDVEVECIFDFAACVARGQLDVDDHSVFRIVRIKLAVRLADELFVLTDAGEGVAAEGRRFPGDDHQLSNTRVGC